MGGGGGCPGGAGRAASHLAVLQSHQQLTALISGRLDATTSESSCRAFFTATSAPPLASSESSKGRLCAPPSAMARRRCCCRSRPAAARDGRFMRRPWVMAGVEKWHNTIFRSAGCGRAVVMRAAASGAAAWLPPHAARVTKLHAIIAADRSALDIICLVSVSLQSMGQVTARCRAAGPAV